MYAPLTQKCAVVEAGHDRLLHDAGIDAEPKPELEFDQTLGWQSCVVEMAHVAERGSGAAVVRREVWSAKSGLQAACIFRLLRASNLC